MQTETLVKHTTHATLGSKKNHSDISLLFSIVQVNGTGVLMLIQLLWWKPFFDYFYTNLLTRCSILRQYRCYCRIVPIYNWPGHAPVEWKSSAAWLSDPHVVFVGSLQIEMHVWDGSKNKETSKNTKGWINVLGEEKLRGPFLFPQNPLTKKNKQSACPSLVLSFQLFCILLNSSLSVV